MSHSVVCQDQLVLSLLDLRTVGVAIRQHESSKLLKRCCFGLQVTIKIYMANGFLLRPSLFYQFNYSQDVQSQ